MKKVELNKFLNEIKLSMKIISLLIKVNLLNKQEQTSIKEVSS